MTAPAPTRAATAAAAVWTACFLLGLCLAPGFNSFESPDYETVRALATGGHLWVARDSGGIYHTGVDGRIYAVHEIGSVLFAAPLALAAAPIARAVHADFKRIYELSLGVASAALLASTVVLLLALARRLGAPAGPTASRLVLLLVASQYLVYATSPPDVSISAPLLAGCVLAWQRAEDDGRPRDWALAGLLAGLLVAVKLTNATVALLLLGLALVSGRRPRRAEIARTGLVLVGLLPGAVMVGWWNALRTGHALATPYPGGPHGLHLSLVPAGIASALVSPNKGMLVFTPALLLLPWAMCPGGILARHRRLAVLLFGSWLIALVRIGGTVGGSSWGGWGNRYYVPWIPVFLLILAVSWASHAASGRGRRSFWIVTMWTLVGIGAVENAAGILTNQMYRQQLCGYGEWTLHGMNVCAVEALPANLARVAGARIPDVVVPGASAANVFASNRLALWWYAIRTLGVRPAVSWAIGLLLLAGAALAWRRARDAEPPP